MVLAGYLAAFALASIAVVVRVANTSGPDAQASSGMYAFGDVLLFAAVFGTAGLLPTGLGFVFLRPYRLFWLILSAVGVVIATTGVTALALFAIGRAATAPPSLGPWDALAVLRILPTTIRRCVPDCRRRLTVSCATVDALGSIRYRDRRMCVRPVRLVEPV